MFTQLTPAVGFISLSAFDLPGVFPWLYGTHLSQPEAQITEGIQHCSFGSRSALAPPAVRSKRDFCLPTWLSRGGGTTACVVHTPVLPFTCLPSGSATFFSLQYRHLVSCSSCSTSPRVFCELLPAAILSWPKSLQQRGRMRKEGGSVEQECPEYIDAVCLISPAECAHFTRLYVTSICRGAKDKQYLAAVSEASSNRMFSYRFLAESKQFSHLRAMPTLSFVMFLFGVIYLLSSFSSFF